MSYAPGKVRDEILRFFTDHPHIEASLNEIIGAVKVSIGEVPESSIRSYLNINTPVLFARTSRGHYRLVEAQFPQSVLRTTVKNHKIAKATLYHTDCLTWLADCKPSSIHAVITDPPYGLREYSSREQAKLRRGRGGVWRIPPSFDGHQRAPLPRFTVLDQADKNQLEAFFKTFGALLYPALVPGANVAIASNPLLAHIVSTAMSNAGFEMRGSVVRLTMTMRGGDRPKNAHLEFDQVSVMPRSMWEPWIILRKPIEGRVQDNLRKWKTGGWRRPSIDRPFGDVIRSSPTTAKERALAPHPSLKPQSFLRQIVYGSLPLGEGVVLDPFAGSGSALAAANAVGYSSIGVEKDETYFNLARQAIEPLSRIKSIDPVLSQLFDSVTSESRSSGSQLSTLVPAEV